MNKLNAERTKTATVKDVSKMIIHGYNFDDIEYLTALDREADELRVMKYYTLNPKSTTPLKRYDTLTRNARNRIRKRCRDENNNEYFGY